MVFSTALATAVFGLLIDYDYSIEKISAICLVYTVISTLIIIVFKNSYKPQLLNKTWFFLISWYNYYDFFFSFTVTDLNLLREIYFYNNSFEFFLINFVLFYGIISSILACFLIKRIFSFLNVSQYINYNLLFQTNATYFIRNQNFLKQQSTSSGTRVWRKKKSLNL